jgi:serine/threonine protein kinase
MTDELGLCPGCFQESRTDGACRRCGYQHDSGAFPSALQPGTVLTKYTLGRVLGKPGGFGITYLAYDGVLQRRVAIKELMPRELVARRPDGASVHVHTRDDGETFKYTLASFLKEARLLAQLTHSNVVRVLDYFEANGTAYFAMEYYEGRTLAAYTMRAGGRLSGAEAVTLMLPLLDALDQAARSRPYLRPALRRTSSTPRVASRVRGPMSTGARPRCTISSPGSCHERPAIASRIRASSLLVR